MPHYQVLRVAGGAALKVRLSKGELIKAESDALVVKNEWIELGANMDGGVLGGLVRHCDTSDIFVLYALDPNGDFPLPPPKASHMGNSLPHSLTHIRPGLRHARLQARKFLTGESLYFQTLKATQGDDNEVLLAAQMLGDIALVELSTLTDTLCLQSGAFLAADDTGITRGRCGHHTLAYTIRYILTTGQSDAGSA
eukprot:1634900-Pyramimonas_sp.AAC.1